MREKVQRVVVCGNSVALAGIETSLGLAGDCEVVDQAMPVGARELGELQPDVIIFELEAMPHEFVYSLSRELPRLPGQPPLLLIGIDLEHNRAMLWSSRQAEGWNSEDLAQVIHLAAQTRECTRKLKRGELPGQRRAKRLE